MIGLAFLHGWGFGPEAWAPWRTAFPDRTVETLDAGYFGPERMSLPDNPDGWIGIGHSLGFARLLSLPTSWRGMIGFGAFLHFCRKDAVFPKDTGAAPELLDAMNARLDADPADVLSRFVRRCGHQGICPTPPLKDGLFRLRNDLVFLRDLDLRGHAQSQVKQEDTASDTSTPPPILLLHALDDRIVSPLLAQEATAQLPNAHLIQLGSGGHALPFTRTVECLPYVQKFLQERDRERP